jgi:hypothetical protein
MNHHQLVTLSFGLALATSGHSAVIASYTFDPNTVADSVASVTADTSAQTDWSTTSLMDQATGIGALSASNQTGTNRTVTIGATASMLSLSSNREGDAQTPILVGGNNESTWLSFTITPGAGVTLNFSENSATVDTYANHGAGLGGTVSADWTLYFSTDGGSSWTSLGTNAGAATNGASQNIGPVPLSWDLSPIGTQTSAVALIIDPVSTGSTNGNVAQRGVSFDNLVVNADVIPEPSAGLLALLGLNLALRRRRSRAA